MFVILPANSTVRALPMVMLLVLMCGLGFCFAFPATVLLLAPRLLTSFDFVGIPAALLAGWIILRLGGQLTKTSIDGCAGGIFSSVGVSAWVIFLMVSAALGGGMCLGRMAGLDEKAHPPFQSDRHFTRRAAPLNPNTANVETGRGKIFMGTATAAMTNSGAHQ